jgi:hypothetical protein
MSLPRQASALVPKAPRSPLFKRGLGEEFVLGATTRCMPIGAPAAQTILRALRGFCLLSAVIVTLAACAMQEGARGITPTESGTSLKTLQPLKGPEQRSPQLIVGRDGALHLFWLAVEPRGSWDIFYSRSQDYGATWLESPSSLKADKETIVQGMTVAADATGHLYAAWRQSDQATKKQHRLMLARSLDGGRRWEPAKELASSSTIGLPYLLVDDDGRVHIAWLKGPLRDRRHLEFRTSHDHGETFAGEPAGLQWTDPTSRLGLVNVRIASDGTGHVYVVWEEDPNRRSARIYLNRSTDYGRTWAEKPILVSPPEDSQFGVHSPLIVAAPGGRVAVMWEQFDERVITPQGRSPQTRLDRVLVVNRSLDGGQSWLTKPIRLNVIDPAAPEAVESLHNLLSADEQGHLYTVWAEGEGGDFKRLLLAHSSDFGSTWSSPPVQLERTSPTGGPQGAPMIRHDDRGHVWVVWLERVIQPDGWQILTNRSEDYGQTWRRRASLLTGSAQPPDTIRGQTFQADSDGRLFVAWGEGRRDYQGIVITRSVDAGRTWLPQPVRIGRP